MQATVREFDAADGSGSVFLDDGTVGRFGRPCSYRAMSSAWRKVSELSSRPSISRHRV